MKLKFRHQKFQGDAAKAVCDVFAGQPFHAPTYRIDPGLGQIRFDVAIDFTGFNNAPIAIGEDKILENIQAIQRAGQIKPSDELYGRYNLTVEMETGERVIIVMGALNVILSRVSGTLTKYYSYIA